MMTSGSMSGLELAGQHHVHEGQRHEGGKRQTAEGLLLFQGLAAQRGGEALGHRRDIDHALKPPRWPRPGPR